MPWLEPVMLSGPHARLEPLSHAHQAGLVEAVKDGELWKLWYTLIPQPQAMAKEIDRRLSLQTAGSMLPFTVFDASGQIADSGLVEVALFAAMAALRSSLLCAAPARGLFKGRS